MDLCHKIRDISFSVSLPLLGEVILLLHQAAQEIKELNQDNRFSNVFYNFGLIHRSSMTSFKRDRGRKIVIYSKKKG